MRNPGLCVSLPSICNHFGHFSSSACTTRWYFLGQPGCAKMGPLGAIIMKPGNSLVF